MKQQKISAYKPNYPKKLLKGAILMTAAAIALTGTAGCDRLRTGGAPEPEPTDELVLDGEVGYEDPDLPGDESTPEEEPALMGKIVIPEETTGHEEHK